MKQKFKEKSNTVMLPSNFARSDTLNINIREEFDKVNENVTPSSACYDIKRVIGQTHIP